MMRRELVETRWGVNMARNLKLATHDNLGKKPKPNLD
jgi:hypothetical protein